MKVRSEDYRNLKFWWDYLATRWTVKPPVDLDPTEQSADCSCPLDFPLEPTHG